MLAQEEEQHVRWSGLEDPLMEPDSRASSEAKEKRPLQKLRQIQRRTPAQAKAMWIDGVLWVSLDTPHIS